MQLKYLKIQRYKNLDFKITFPEDGVAVLIGNNGSGKSNVLEAISLVFGHYYDSNLIKKPNFEYVIKYEKDGQTIELTPKKEQIDISKLPEKIICYYSGEEARLWNDIYKKIYENENQKYIENASFPKIPQLLFVNKYYWRIAFILLTLKGKLFDYDISDSEYLIQKNKENIKKWKENIGDNLILKFADNLPESNNLSKLFEIENNLDELFLKFYFSYMPKNNKLIENIIIKNIKKGNVYLNFQEFSEGEKRLILYKFIINFLATQDTILLFDEIDNNIHPANKRIFKEVLFEEFENLDKNVIFTTHSPTLTTIFNDKNLFMFDNGSIVNYDLKKKAIISKLTENNWSYFEINEILTTNEDIVLVEGETDRLYLEETLKIFKNNGKFIDLNLKFIPTGGADNNMEFFIENLILKDKQKLFVLLDNDNSGKQAREKFKDKKDKDKVLILTLPKPGDKFKDGDEWEIEDFFDKEVVKEIAKKNYIKQIENNLNSFPKLNKKGIGKESIKKSIREEFKNFIENKNSLINNYHISKFKKIFKEIEKIKNESK